MEPIIKVKAINFTYNQGKDNEYHALININTEIYPEEYVIFFGPSGCGKSTLLNIIAGLEKPDSGTIEVFGRDLTKMTSKEFALYHRSQVGMVFQQYNLITSLTVLDNVALPQMFVNVRRGKRNHWGKTLLERFGILKQAYKLPTELSGGQQQRIGIARAIVNNPKIVLADEPVGNLDSVSAKNVMEIFSDLNEKEKKTFIMVTHNPEHLPYADRILYMKDGIITREVVNREKRRKDPDKKDDKIEDGFVKLRAPAMEIKDLMRAYHGLSPEQINILIMPYKAKIFAHHFITTRSMEETQMFEEVIQRRLLGTISEDEFLDVLKRSYLEGGVGFDPRTAEKIIQRVNNVIKTAYFIYQEAHQKANERGEHEKITIEEKVVRLSDYLLKTCYGEFIDHLNDVQVNRFRAAVKERVEGTMQKPNFFDSLDKPFKQGGVGLNSKTAKAITEEIELVLILGFGIVQNKADEARQEVRKKEEESAKLKIKEEIQAVKTKEAEEKIKLEKMPIEAIRNIGELVKEIKKEAGAYIDIKAKLKGKTGYESSRDIRSSLPLDSIEAGQAADSIIEKNSVDPKAVAGRKNASVSLSEMIEAAQRRDEEAKK